MSSITILSLKPKIKITQSSLVISSIVYHTVGAILREGNALTHCSVDELSHVLSERISCKHHLDEGYRKAQLWKQEPSTQAGRWKE